MNKTVVLSIRGVALSLLLTACAMQGAPEPSYPPPFSPPAPRWTTYQFSWQAPAAPVAKPAPLTVAVVKPFAADKESAFAALAFRKMAKGFAGSMGTDLDKALVAKGVKVSGPHDAWDEMTYADKQAADMALAPKVFLTAEIRHEPGRIVGGQAPGGGGGGGGVQERLGPQQLVQARPILVAAAGGPMPFLAAREVAMGRNPSARRDARVAQRGKGGDPEPPPLPPAGPAYIERKFTMIVQGHIALEIREPLSNQKLWVKKLELEPVEHSGTEYFEAPEGSVTASAAEPDANSKLLVDAKQEALADVMQQWYPAIMQKCWKYLDVAEMLSLKPQVEEIRKVKRY
jgi:hypothetical protein